MRKIYEIYIITYNAEVAYSINGYGNATPTYNCSQQPSIKKSAYIEGLCPLSATLVRTVAYYNHDSFESLVKTEEKFSHRPRTLMLRSHLQFDV